MKTATFLFDICYTTSVLLQLLFALLDHYHHRLTVHASPASSSFMTICPSKVVGTSFYWRPIHPCSIRQLYLILQILFVVWVLCC